MARHRDEKLQTIARSVVGRGCSANQLRDLGRAGDLIECAAGQTFHTEHDANRWAYLLLDGDVALSQGGAPLAVASRGSVFPWRPTASPSSMALTALDDSRLLVFRWSELDDALERRGPRAGVASR